MTRSTPTPSAPGRGRPLQRWYGALLATLAATAALLAPPALARAASAPQGTPAASAAGPRADCPPVPREPSAEQLQAALQAARDRGFLWRISKGGRDSYLYGTIHVGKLDWAFPGPRVREALEGSETLALELDLTDPDVLAQLSRSMKPDATRGTRFQLPPAAQQRLARQAQLACVGPDVLSGQHPVMQAITLTVLAARHDGLDPSYAQELVLGGIARAIDKRIVSLESAEMQAGLLVPSDQKQALAITEQTLTQLEKGQARAMLVKVARVWDESDLEQLSNFEQWCGCADTEDARQFLRRVNDDRNGPMAERIDGLHSGGRTVFAAVGALHMTGPRGLPQLLQQRGYTVERVRFAPR